LFYGLPGTAKSQCVLALANHFNLPIYYLDLNAVTSNSKLMTLMSDLPRTCPFILLLEDIDTLEITQERSSTQSIKSNTSSYKINSLTLSSLLNILDGLISPENMIVIMTTNHIECLDEALIRKGRINDAIEFKPLTKPLIIEYCNKFLGYQLTQSEQNQIPNDLLIKGCDLANIILDITTHNTHKELTHEFFNQLRKVEKI
jgi:chaperone BCS1